MAPLPDSPYAIMDRFKMRILCEYYGLACLLAGEGDLPFYNDELSDGEQTKAQELRDEIRRHIDEETFPADAVLLDWSRRLGDLHSALYRRSRGEAAAVSMTRPPEPASVGTTVRRTDGGTVMAPDSWLLDDAIRAHILRALKASQGRIEGKGGAAVLLGLKPSTLRSRMKRLGIR